MYNFFGFLTLILLILTLISLILAIFKPKLLMKKFNEKYHSRKYAFALTFLLFILIICSAISLNNFTPPEIKAKIQQQQEEQKLEKEKQKAEAEKMALIDKQNKEAEQKELNAIKEREKAQAEAQKVFDDQKAYEEWVPNELERIAKEAAGDNFKSIKVNKNYGKEPGAYIIIIQTDAGVGFTNNQVKKSTWFEDMDIFKKLYNSGISIASIKIVTYSTLIDAYGQKSDAPIMRAKMSLATANKIGWDNFIIDNFPNITEDYWIHPALLK